MTIANAPAVLFSLGSLCFLVGNVIILVRGS